MAQRRTERQQRNRQQPSRRTDYSSSNAGGRHSYAAQRKRDASASTRAAAAAETGGYAQSQTVGQFDPLAPSDTYDQSAYYAQTAAYGQAASYGQSAYGQQASAYGQQANAYDQQTVAYSQAAYGQQAGAYAQTSYDQTSSYTQTAGQYGQYASNDATSAYGQASAYGQSAYGQQANAYDQQTVAYSQAAYGQQASVYGQQTNAYDQQAGAYGQASYDQTAVYSPAATQYGQVASGYQAGGSDQTAYGQYASYSGAAAAGTSALGTISAAPSYNGGNYSQYSQANGKKGSKKDGGKQPKKGGKKALKIVLVILLLIIIGIGAAAYFFIKSVDDSLKGGKTEKELLAIQEKLVATTSFEEPFYMVLIGSDARADDEEMGQRSDTNILVRVDPVLDQVTMISIPRDTMITIPGYGTCKFNAAYSVGGAAQVIEEASKLCGVDIAHYAEVSFTDLEGLVDAVGGVDVDVPFAIDDPQSGPAILSAGYQHLDGVSALTFARCRQYVDGDFTRTSNQRTLVKAIITQALSLAPTALPSAIQAAAKCVGTDLSVRDIYSLAKQFQDVGNLTMYSAMVPSTTADIDGASYVICDQYGLANMMKVINAGGDPNTAEASGLKGSTLVDEHSVTITTNTGNQTSTSGSGGSQ